MRKNSRPALKNGEIRQKIGRGKSNRAGIGSGARKKKENSLQDDSRNKKFWKMVMDFVPYSKFIDLEPRLKVNRFLEIRTLYVLDEFWDVTDEEICEKLYVEPAQLAALRANPHYPTIGAAIQAAAAGLAAAKTLDEWAETVEDQTAAELWMIASGDGLARDRVAALTAFADRRSAKKGREPDPAPPISLPAEFVEKLMWVMRQRELSGSIVGDVDGGVLNVPKRIEAKKRPAAEEN